MNFKRGATIDLTIGTVGGTLDATVTAVLRAQSGGQPSGQPVAQFSVELMDEPLPGQQQTWCLTISAADSLALEPGDYVTDAKFTSPGGVVRKTSTLPLRILQTVTE